MNGKEFIKVELFKAICGVFLMLNSLKELFIFYGYLLTLYKDMTFPLITQFNSKRVLKLFTHKSNSDLNFGLHWLNQKFKYTHLWWSRDIQWRQRERGGWLSVRVNKQIR